MEFQLAIPENLPCALRTCLTSTHKCLSEFLAINLKIHLLLALFLQLNLDWYESQERDNSTPFDNKHFLEFKLLRLEQMKLYT